MTPKGKSAGIGAVLGYRQGGKKGVDEASAGEDSGKATTA